MNIIKTVDVVELEDNAATGGLVTLLSLLTVVSVEVVVSSLKVCELVITGGTVMSAKVLFVGEDGLLVDVLNAVDVKVVG